MPNAHGDENGCSKEDESRFLAGGERGGSNKSEVDLRWRWLGGRQKVLNSYVQYPYVNYQVLLFDMG